MNKRLQDVAVGRGWVEVPSRVAHRNTPPYTRAISPNNSCPPRRAPALTGEQEGHGGCFQQGVCTQAKAACPVEAVMQTRCALLVRQDRVLWQRLW